MLNHSDKGASFAGKSSPPSLSPLVTACHRLSPGRVFGYVTAGIRATGTLTASGGLCGPWTARAFTATSGGVSTGSVVCGDATSSGTVSAPLFASNTVQVQRARRLLHQPGDRPAEGAEAQLCDSVRGKSRRAVLQAPCAAVPRKVPDYIAKLEAVPPAAEGVASPRHDVPGPTARSLGQGHHGAFHPKAPMSKDPLAQWVKFPAVIPVAELSRPTLAAPVMLSELPKTASAWLRRRRRWTSALRRRLRPRRPLTVTNTSDFSDDLILTKNWAGWSKL